jgi:L-lactate dehydrogenase (cytochrome)
MHACIHTKLTHTHPPPLQVSTSASYPIETIIASAPTHPFFFQLYVNKNRSASETLLRQISSLSNNNVSAIFVTADAPSPGKREADERIRADETLRTPMGGMTAINDRRGGGLARIMGSFIDDRLNWDDLGWLRRHWKGKVVLKGIMGAEDAMRAAREGVDGIVLR